MNSIEKINNFLPKEQFDNITKTILDENFPWYLSKVLPEDKVAINKNHNTQFVHNFYSEHLPRSPFIGILQPLIDIIKPRSLIRIKANLLNRTDEKIIHGFHNDVEYNCTTAVYYLNSNNGETVFENNQHIKSEANTFVYFPSKLKHSGTTNTCDNPFRIVINFNYF